MRNFILTGLILCLLTCFSSNSEAQIFKKVLDETKNKLGETLEDIVVDKASDIIVKKLNHSLNKHIDNQIENAFKGSEFYTEEENYNSTKNQAALAGYLSTLNASVDLPESYLFDTEMRVELKDANNTSEIIYYFSKNKQIFGLGANENGDSQIMVYDMENNLMVIYMKDENGKEHAQAIPMNTALVGSIIDSELEKEGLNYTIRPSGKTAIVAGKKCEGYIGVGEDSTTEFYTTTDVGISYSDTFSGLIDNVSNSEYQNMLSSVNGMMMKAITMEDGEETIWEVKSIKSISKTMMNN